MRALVRIAVTAVTRARDSGHNLQKRSLFVAIFVEVKDLLKLVGSESLSPLVEVTGGRLGGNARLQRFGFGEELVVKALGYFIEAVPLCVVRSHHRRAHARTSPLVMPQFVISPLELVVERRFGELAVGEKLVHDRLRGPGELLVVQIDSVVILLVEVFDPTRGMTIRADLLHRLAALGRVLELDGNGRAERPANSRAGVVSDRLGTG